MIKYHTNTYIDMNNNKMLIISHRPIILVVGPSAGAGVESLVGYSVGACVGSCVGAAVGVFVGAAMGVGASVGFSVSPASSLAWEQWWVSS